MPLDKIDVVLPPFTDSTFDTLEKAFAGGKAITHERVNAQVSSRFGSVIHSATWSDTAVHLHLDDGKTLSFQCVQNYVHITLDDPPADIFPGLPERVLLRLAGQTWEWERAGLITALAGRKLHHIEATESTYFLYVKGLEILVLYPDRRPD